MVVKRNHSFMKPNCLIEAIYGLCDIDTNGEEDKNHFVAVPISKTEHKLINMLIAYIQQELKYNNEEINLFNYNQVLEIRIPLKDIREKACIVKATDDNKTPKELLQVEKIQDKEKRNYFKDLVLADEALELAKLPKDDPTLTSTDFTFRTLYSLKRLEFFLREVRLAEIDINRKVVNDDNIVFGAFSCVTSVVLKKN